MADPALITGGTAVLTGGVGYLTARLQHKGEKQRLLLEESKLKSELQTHSEERSEAAIESRRDLYLAYVDTFDAAWHLCQDPGVTKTSTVDKWWSDYQAIQQRMALLAAGSVTQAMEAMRPLVSDFAADLEVAIETNSTDKIIQASARRDVWNEHAQAIQQTQRSIEAQMRIDLRSPE